MCSQSEGSGWASIVCVTGTKPSVCARAGVVARAAIATAAAINEEVLIVASSQADLKVRLYVRVPEGPPLRSSATNDEPRTANREPRTPNHEPRTANHEPPAAYWSRSASIATLSA